MHVTTQQKAVKKEKEKRKGLNLICKPGETLVHSRFRSSFTTTGSTDSTCCFFLPLKNVHNPPKGKIELNIDLMQNSVQVHNHDVHNRLPGPELASNSADAPNEFS
jgi:hypothetical protein